MLSYVMRDFVDSWYKKLTDDELFRESLRRTARRSIASLSQWLVKLLHPFRYIAVGTWQRLVLLNKRFYLRCVRSNSSGCVRYSIPTRSAEGAGWSPPGASSDRNKTSLWGFFFWQITLLRMGREVEIGKFGVLHLAFPHSLPTGDCEFTSKKKR